MDPTSAISIVDWLRVLLIYCHVGICAFAITTVLKADFKILLSDFCREDIGTDAKRISYLLAGLWISGLAIIYLDTGFSTEIMMTKSKLLLKLLCVLMLTLNGLMLHQVSFPVLTRASEASDSEAVMLAVTGALSTSHWLLAAFIGMSAPLGQLPLHTLLQGYSLFLGSTILVSLTCVPLINRVKSRAGPETLA